MRYTDAQLTQTPGPSTCLLPQTGVPSLVKSSGLDRGKDITVLTDRYFFFFLLLSPPSDFLLDSDILQVV